MRQKGQLSLEFLIILAAFFGVLLTVTPLLLHAYSLAETGLNKKAAQIFLAEVKGKSGQLKLLGNGSRFELQAAPLKPWTLSFDGERLAIAFDDLNGQSLEPLGADLTVPAFELRDQNDSFISGLDIRQATVFELRKENNTIILDKT